MKVSVTFVAEKFPKEFSSKIHQKTTENIDQNGLICEAGSIHHELVSILRENCVRVVFIYLYSRRAFCVIFPNYNNEIALNKYFLYSQGAFIGWGTGWDDYYAKYIRKGAQMKFNCVSCVLKFRDQKPQKKNTNWLWEDAQKALIRFQGHWKSLNFSQFSNTEKTHLKVSLNGLFSLNGTPCD